MTPIISILICHLYRRAGMLAGLLRELERQINVIGVERFVEILVEADNGENPTGRKRNILYQKASGKYVISLDDDDRVPPYYIQELLIAAHSDADCFAIGGLMYTNGSNEKKWYISKDNAYEARVVNGEECYFRYPNHITCIKRDIAASFKFHEIYVGEDYNWATEIHKSGAIKTEYAIKAFPMYIYDYRSVNKT